MTARDLLVVAGEASGDLHGARMLQELVAVRPALDAWGLGGDEMRRAGFDPIAHSSEISVVGIAEALKIVGRARQIFGRILEEVERRRTAEAVLIDFPEFNLRLARQLHRRGVRVLYYISPQVWAWRRGRVRAISRDVERMLVLFPFETGFYRRFGVDVQHVGHPLVDEVPRLTQAWEGEEDLPQLPVLSLLPGSRRSEVTALLPTLLETARRLAEERPLSVRLIEAPTVPPELFEALIGEAGLEVERVRHDRFTAIAGSHLALCASGTATLEVGLLGTPLIMVYRLRRWSYFLGRLLVRLPAFAMVNLVLGERVVPEMVQNQSEPAQLAAAASALMRDRPRVDEMRRRLAPLRSLLGPPGASRRAAQEVDRFLEAPQR